MLSTKSLEQSGKRVSALAHRGVDRVLDTSYYLRKKAEQVSDQTVDYVKHDPVKAVLIAAATAAALMAVFSLLSHSRDRR